MPPTKPKRAIRADFDAIVGEEAMEHLPRLPILENAATTCNDAEGYAREIGKLWDEAQQKFISIGRYLVLARKTLADEDYKRLITTMLPFGVSVARKLRTVAEAVNAERLPLRTLPRSYVNAYELAVLKDQHLHLAEQRDLVRPDVTRREIEEFKAELRQPTLSERRSELLRERQRLMARLMEIDSELQQNSRPLVGGEGGATDCGELETT
jgi:hypothetical protein